MEPNVTPTAQPTPQPTPAPAPTPGIGMAPNYQPTPAPDPAPQPAPQPEPNQPAPQTEPQPQPAPQPTPQPDGTVPQQNPQPQPTQEPVKTQQSYEEYLDSLTKADPIELPKPTDIDKDDPEGLVKFFEEFGKATEARARQAMQQESAIQRAETDAWNEVFTKYPEIKENKALRDTVHNIRMGAYNSGQLLSPLQVADGLVGTLHDAYKKGINDNQVQVRIQDSQPLNGGGNPPAPSGVNYENIQLPGQAGMDAAVSELQKLIDAGKI